MRGRCKMCELTSWHLRSPDPFATSSVLDDPTWTSYQHVNTPSSRQTHARPRSFRYSLDPSATFNHCYNDSGRDKWTASVILGSPGDIRTDEGTAPRPRLQRWRYALVWSVGINRRAERFFLNSRTPQASVCRRDPHDSMRRVPESLNQKSLSHRQG